MLAFSACVSDWNEDIGERGALERLLNNGSSESAAADLISQYYHPPMTGSCPKPKNISGQPDLI